MLSRISWLLLGVLLVLPGIALAKERSGEVVIAVTLAAPDDSKDVRVWIPYPVSGSTQDISDIKIDGNFTRSGVYGEKETGNLALYAEWAKPIKDRAITLTFNVTAKERVSRNIPAREPEIPAEIREYLNSTAFIPTDGKIREIAIGITNDQQKVSEKARAVYQWVVENTVRDPNVMGCGTGEVEKVLAKKGGKCADISSVFVSIARAAGVPAREVFGLRLGKKDEEDMTGGHHCWAEFYAPGYGWVPVDPSDVRKVMLTDKLDISSAQKYVDYYFGAVDEYRVTLATGGRGYFLNPRQNDGPLNYFMYPYAEVGGKSLEWLAAQTDLKFKVMFKAR
ncbi:MAG: transglutaminase domain-containing protein [Gallionellaceae bacterium]|nr:MAG: transglutaminase domain-containing protein [Gallionellaceae bacterium]